MVGAGKGLVHDPVMAAQRARAVNVKGGAEARGEVRNRNLLGEQPIVFVGEIVHVSAEPPGAETRARPNEHRFYHRRAESINRRARRNVCARAYGAGAVMPGSGAGVGSLKFSGVSGGTGGVRVCATMLDGSLW